MSLTPFSRRCAASAVGAGLLLTAVTACGPVRAASPPQRVDAAVHRVTAQESATLVARLDASPQRVRALLAEAGRPLSARQAELLARAELTVAVEADRPLNELDGYGRTRLAMSLNFGGADVVSYKSVGDRVYLRLRPTHLAYAAGLTGSERRRVTEFVRLADELPGSLGGAGALLKGHWVKLDLDDFTDFEWAAERLVDVAVSREEARKAGSVLDGDVPRELLGRLETLLLDHARQRRTVGGSGSGSGDRVVTVTLPARTAVRELAPVLRGLGVWLRPTDVPDREVTAELTLRRGELSGVTVDLARLLNGGDAAGLPLRLGIASGDALSVTPPASAVELRPQDLVTSFLFATLHPLGTGNPADPR